MTLTIQNSDILIGRGVHVRVTVGTGWIALREQTQRLDMDGDGLRYMWLKLGVKKIASGPETSQKHALSAAMRVCALEAAR